MSHAASWLFAEFENTDQCPQGPSLAGPADRVFGILRENNPELTGEKRRTIMKPPQVRSPTHNSHMTAGTPVAPLVCCQSTQSMEKFNVISSLSAGMKEVQFHVLLHLYNTYFCIAVG